MNIEQRFRKWIPYLVLVAALLLTGLVTRYVARTIEARDRLRFANNVSRTQDNIQNRIDIYIALIRSGAALHAADETVNLEEFRAFVGRIGLSQRYPGVQGLGYTRRIAPEELEEVTRAVREGGQPAFRVWPDDPRPEYHAIVYLEPLDARNQQAIGFDMFTEPVRREAMARARDTAQAAMSGKVTLVQEIDEKKQAGFLIYVPVYRDGTVPSSVAERRAALEGFTYSPFRADDLLENIFGRDRSPGVAFEVYDGLEVEADKLLHRSDSAVQGTTGATVPRFTTTTTFEVAGRPWTVVFSDRPGFAVASGMYLVPLTLLGGLVTSLVLFGVTLAQVQARTAAERTASELRASEEALRLLAEAGAALTASLDYEATLDTVASLAVPRLADWCAIDIVQENGVLRQLAVAHVDPAKIQLARELRRRYPATPDPDAEQGTYKVLRTGEPELVRQVTAAMIEAAARDAEHLALLRQLGLCSFMAVPLVARQRHLGVISLASAESGREFGEADLDLAMELARRAAQAVDNAALYREAQEAILARDRFLSMASHELRTPITSIKGYAHLMERRAAREGVSPRDLQAMQVISDEADRLNKLVNQLLDISRIQNDQFALDRNEVDLVVLVRRLVATLQPTMEQHSLELALCDNQPILVNGDVLRLEQVVRNLIQNAIKYSPEGGPIEIGLDRTGDEARLTVSDQGIGIPEEALPELFNRFFRASNVDEYRIEGMGLGLYVVHHIVEAHGGRVEVDSKVGVGTTFTVMLPLLQPQGAPAGAMPSDA